MLLVASLVALVASLAVTGVASAASVTGGTTTLDLKKGTVKKLKKQGVKVKASDGASKTGRTLGFRITGGNLDRGGQYTSPETPLGVVNHDGGVKFKCKGGKVNATDLIVTFTAPSDVTGTSKGSQLRLAKLSNLVGSASEDGTKVTGAKAKFTNSSKRALKRACDIKMKKKLTIGHFNVDADTTIDVFSGQTDIEPAPAFVGQLVQAQAAPSADAPATLDGSGFHFPVTGGEIDPNTFTGQIRHAGGITLNENPADAPPTQVIVQEPFIDLEGPTGGSISMFSVNLQTRASLFNATLTAPPTLTGSTLVAEADLTLSLAAATALNQELADPDENGGQVFAPGDPVGHATLTATVG